MAAHDYGQNGQRALFGGVEPPREYARTNFRIEPKPNGYAHYPGTGPRDETCRTCRHCAVKHLGQRNAYKCGLRRAMWDASRASDVLLKSPACKHWEQGEPHEITARIHNELED